MRQKKKRRQPIIPCQLTTPGMRVAGFGWNSLAWQVHYLKPPFKYLKQILTTNEKLDLKRRLITNIDAVLCSNT